MAEIFSVHAIKLSTLETFTLPTERLTKFSAPLSLSMPFCRSVFEGRVGRGRREGEEGGRSNSHVYKNFRGAKSFVVVESNLFAGLIF